tara:strand:+ start:3385 stop:4029 length:645 start_codon:yes stop_codon:yes gene_type:complete
MGPEGSALKLSENGQEWFVLDKLHYKRDGYFVDIGAGDGIVGSNTFVLEKFYDWKGICVDPNPEFFKSLIGSRDVSIIDLSVDSESGKVKPFLHAQSQDFFGWNFRSGLKEVVNQQDHNFKEINTYTISLNDLLHWQNTPKDIDYISIDVEGNEYNILKSFDFKKYNVKIWTVEHDFGVQRDKIQKLFDENGYNCILDDFGPQNEDKYVKKSLT